MSELIAFVNPDFGELRAVEQNGETWFVAADVCRVLEIKNSRDAVSRLDEDEKGVVLTDTPSGKQAVNVVNEPGLYTLVIGSRKKEAKAFKRWITHDVVPSIRKNGGYIAGQEQLTDDELLAKALLVAQKTIEAREARISELTTQNTALLAENEQQRQTIADFEPVRQYVDVILESTGVMATTQIAADYGLSAKALNRILHEAGVQHKVNGQWILYREHMGKGYTDSRTFPITRRNGAKDSAVHTYWTQKGRLMIHNILTDKGIVALMDRKEG